MISDLSKVYSFLLENRIVETEPRERRFKNGEATVAKILTDNPGILQTLAEFLEPMGLEVQVWDETMAPGISRDGFVYFLVRTGEGEPPCFGEDRYLEILRDGTTEARDVTAVWFLHLWLLLSHLLYTSINRSPSEVIRYNEATVTAPALHEIVKSHIEKLRNSGSPDNATAGEVFRILTSHKGMELSRRISRFLEALCQSRLLEEMKDESGLFRQTLLGAVEFEQMFNRTIAPLVSDSADVPLDSITAIVSPEEHDSNEKPMEEATHGAD
jgi:hypothetical protein